MGSKKRKCTAAEKAARARRTAEFITIFVHGRQKRVRRPPTVAGQPTSEFISGNADPLWYHQHGMWENITPDPER